MATCGITLRREAMENYVAGRTQGYRIKITCTVSQCTNVNIFMYQGQCVDPTTGEYAVKFVSVASPADIEETPIYVPGTTTIEAGELYRYDMVDLVFRSLDELEETWNAILRDVGELANTLSKMADADLTSVETVTITGFEFGSVEHPVFRSGIITGTGTNTYTLTFNPPFTEPPTVTATPDKDVSVHLNGAPTATQAQFIASAPLESTDKLYWTAIGY